MTVDWQDTRWWDKIGCCTVCGCEDTKVKMVDEATWVCEECLDRDYFYCDGCEQFWDKDYVEYEDTEDGRTLCEYCTENED